jgi:pyruvate, orthophosphate dikinase
LNLGLNDTAVEGVIRVTGDERFAYDSYRRFIQMFGDIVLKIENEKFEEALADLKEERGVEEDPDLGAGGLERLISTYKKIVEEEADRPFPEDLKEQLELAIQAVFDSWQNDRAITYRK